MYLGKPIIGNFKTKREKRKRVKTPAEKRPGNDPGYLAKIRQLPCCVSGVPGPSEAHHLRCTGKRGGALRAPDCETLPMSHDEHINGVHIVGSKLELKWFKDRGIDPLTLASALWNSRHDMEAMGNILETHRRAE